MELANSKLFKIVLKFVFIVTVGLIGHSICYAQATEIKTVYGPEWTFKSSGSLTGMIPIVVKDMLEVAEKAYPGRVVLQAHFLDTALFVIDGKVELTIAYDMGVIEVQSTPLTVADWKNYKKIIQKILFDVMAENKLVPHEREGAGHINIGTKLLAEHKNLITYFILDFLSRPGVGISLNSETANQEDALNLYDHVAEKLNILNRGSKLTKEQIENPEFVNMMNKLINGARNLKEKSVMPDKSDTTAFVRYLEEKFVALGLRDTEAMNKNNQKYLDFSEERSRMEVRQVRPQQSMNQFIKLIELFEARLNYLHKNGFDQSTFDQKVIYDGWEALGQFADYVEESGLKWADYIEFLPKVWQDLDPQNFIRKKNQKGHDAAKGVRCEALF